jgi:hypothetical protein
MKELDNNADLIGSHNSSHSSNLSKDSGLDWSDLIARTIERLTGKDLQISYIFDNLELEIPKTYGTSEINKEGGAKWKLNGTLTISTALNNSYKVDKK